MTLSNSSFSGNIAELQGGGIYNGDSGAHGVTVSNSTFSGNIAASSDGGGGAVASRWSFGVVNSTFSDNATAGSGGGIQTILSGYVRLRNTIVANTLAGDNCSGNINDGGGNLSYPDTTCPGINADPVLGPLQDNGGLTWTMALGEGSAAIDAGDDAICAAAPVNNLDQRSVTRPQGVHCDIGAVEQILDPTVVGLAALSAHSAPAVLPPLGVSAMLLAVLATIGMYRRSSHPA